MHRFGIVKAVTLLIVLLLFLPVSGVLAQDMRAVKVKETRALLEKRASGEKEQAVEESRKARAAIFNDRKQLEKRLARLRELNRTLRAEVKALEKEATTLSQKEKEVSAELAQAEDVVHDLVGVVRLNAKDIKALVEQNLQTGLFQPDTGFLDDILDEAKFPGMDDVRSMVELLKAQINQTGWVVVRDGPMVGRDGRQTTGRILVVGPFTAAYMLSEEAGFLSYAPSGRKFYAASRVPASGVRAAIRDYMEGKTDDIFVDISRGGALREFTCSHSLWEKIRNGGPVVWPILGVFVAGLFIIAERSLFLLRSRLDSDSLVSRIEELVLDGRWDRAIEMCSKFKGKPLAREMLAGLKARGLPREDLENALQEAILGEIPTMERFLSALGMLAAIAPLLGLLGTVTGMINTFHVITMYGTGDPRLMSAGISEALVTTMLGLSTAIPLLMANSLLGGVVERRIADMEEKGIALVNVILRAGSRQVQ